jgi:ferredoxin
MKVHVDMSKCEAYGICAETAPAVFELDEWGYAQVLGDGTVADDQQENARRAVAGCPAKAIQIS